MEKPAVDKHDNFRYGSSSSSSSAADLITSDNDYSLNRSVLNSDIEFLAGYEQVAKMSLQLGWLMFQDNGYSIADVRNKIMKDVLCQPYCVKVTHVIEEWRRLRKHEATARALVEICCHSTIGGDRTFIEESLRSLACPYVPVPGKQLHVFFVHRFTIQST